VRRTFRSRLHPLSRFSSGSTRALLNPFATMTLTYMCLCDRSNGGVFGSLYGTPIINLPQSAVLGASSLSLARGPSPWYHLLPSSLSTLCLVSALRMTSSYSPRAKPSYLRCVQVLSKGSLHAGSRTESGHLHHLWTLIVGARARSRRRDVLIDGARNRASLTHARATLSSC
jgi:hypothetical protein